MKNDDFLPETDFVNPGANFDTGDVIRQSKLEVGEPYRFRIVGKMIPMSSVWYQSKFISQETGEIKQAPRMVRLPIDYTPFGWTKEPTCFDLLADIDLKIRKKFRAVGPGGNDKDIKSIFEPRTIYVVPVLWRQDEVPTIKLLEVSWQAWGQIKQIQTAKDSTNKTKLKHGPVWVGDMEITKVEGDRKTGLKSRNISYKVESCRDHKLAGKLNPDIFEPENREKLIQMRNDAIKLEIFTEEEFQLIAEYDFEEAKKRYVPMTSEEITRMVSKWPVATDAVDFNGNLLFPNPTEFMAELQKAEFDSFTMIEDHSGTTQEEHTPEPAKKTPPKQSPPKAAAKPPVKVEKGEEPATTTSDDGDDDIPEYLR